MMKALYLSSGTFTGRVNGRDPRLLADWFDKLDCDGFELMITDNFYNDWDAICRLYRRRGVPICYVHADKHIGDLLSDPDADALPLFEQNCRMAADLDVHRLVFHPWGIPQSDLHFDKIAARIGDLVALAARYEVEAMPENCLCVHQSPCAHMTALCAQIPGLGIVFDTRQAQFCGELETQLECADFCRAVRHIHINDFAGEKMQWDALYPIPPLGSGNVDWSLFSHKMRAYGGTVTVEAPVMRADGVDFAQLNRNLAFAKKLFE